MQEALARLGEQGLDVNPKDVARLSPVLWQHINFLGRYEVILPESVALGRLKPLRNPTSAWEFWKEKSALMAVCRSAQP